MIEAVAKENQFSLDTPINQLSEDNLRVILYGTDGHEIRVEFVGRNGRKSSFNTSFEGVVGNLERRYRETQSEYVRMRISEFMGIKQCPTCHGKRLRKEALAVLVEDVNIIEVTSWPVNRTLAWVDGLASADASPLSSRQKAIAERILREIRARLGFLVDVGLDYLTLERSASTLSGGEAQRIRLATQVGSKLMGVLYVLDEPSIGLHPRDNRRLLDTLEGLRDMGNTVLVVEHDDETIRSADWVIDLGPERASTAARL
jgi:excinuclease ABC subunit A